MHRAARSVFPPGGRSVDGSANTMKPPVAVTSCMDEDEAANLPDVELKIQPDGVFSTSVGAPSKKTLASAHLTSPEEVVFAMEHLLQG